MNWRPSLGDCVWVGLGGALGTGLRFACAMAWPLTDPVSLPWATLLVNIAGSVLIGIFAAFGLRRGMASGASSMLFLMVGFCGGLTTFSFVSLEAALMLQQAQWSLLLAYLGLSLLGWLGGIVGGFRVGQSVFRSRRP